MNTIVIKMNAGVITQVMTPDVSARVLIIDETSTEIDKPATTIEVGVLEWPETQFDDDLVKDWLGESYDDYFASED